MTDFRSWVEPEYAEYQREFLDRFIGEMAAGSVHILLAPPGTGKSYAIAGAIRELSASHRAHRVLVLAPAPLTQQWGDLLRRNALDPLVVDGRAFRMLRERFGDASKDWPEGVYPMSIDLAKRSEAVAVLLSGAWDLIIVDEAHAVSGQKLELVKALQEGRPRSAILLASSFWNEAINAFSEAGKVIDWTNAAAEFFSTLEQTDGPRLIRQTRYYRRVDEESELAKQVVEVAKDLGPMWGMSLLRAASSSINTLEEGLIRWVGQPEDRSVQRQMLEHLLERVEDTRTDTRLHCFKTLLEELSGNGHRRHIVTFSEYRTTLDYLAAALEPLAVPHCQLHGGMSTDQRLETVFRFEEEGGLLLMTTAVSEGVSLGFVEAVIHYDLPLSPIAFARREGSYRRYSRTQSCDVFFLKDHTGALPLEDLLLRMVQKVDVLKGDVGPEPEELFRQTVE